MEIDVNRYFNKKVEYKNRRDELVSLFVEAINKSREGTKFKKVDKRLVALRLNSNPFLAKDDGEVELLLKECKSKNNFSKFWWVTKKLSETVV